MHIEIETKRLKYELVIKGKYSVIQGDSGNGKTNMCRLLQQRLTGDKTIKISCKIPVVTLASFDDGSRLKNVQNSVVVLDENYKILLEPDAASILKDSDNYFIILYRKNLDFLPLCVENLYEMHTNGRGHWLQQKYTVSGIKDFRGIKHIVTEDRVSGFEFFQDYFNIYVTSANSKSEIITHLQHFIDIDPKYNDILIVYDAAAFAYQNKPANINTMHSNPICA